MGGHYLYDGFGWEGISLKSDNFYPELFESVMNPAKQNPETDLNQWQKVKDWLDDFEPFHDLLGGVLDHVNFDDDKEKEMFNSEYNSDAEKDHHYFWYNKPYVPKRPVLYQILSIASGYIPPKIQLNSSLDINGNLVHHSAKITDDSWILISVSEDTNKTNK